MTPLLCVCGMNTVFIIKASTIYIWATILFALATLYTRVVAAAVVVSLQATFYWRIIM